MFSISFRTDRREFPADFAAYYRGRCWEELGEYAAAIEFLHVAAERRPEFAVAMLQPLFRRDAWMKSRPLLIECLLTIEDDDAV